MAYTHLKPGEQLEVSQYPDSSASEIKISDLVLLPQDELEKKEQASIEKEETIFQEICDKEKEWAQQAGQTVCIRHAKEYLKTPTTEHTSNQWVTDANSWHRMSNMVYKMSWIVHEHSVSRYGGRRGSPGSIRWELSWHVTLNPPHCPPILYTTRTIAGQKNKPFLDKADMEKYLQGRIKAYAHLFTEISPPIPKGDEQYFCVHGVLLPGYTVENPDALKPDETKVDELLAFLEDGEISDEAPAPPPESEPEAPSPQAVWEKHRKQRTGASQRTRAPTR